MSNCFLYALRRWLLEGGCIVMRRSDHGWWPHFLWTADLDTLHEFVPPIHYPVLFPPPLFRGIVRTRTRGEALGKR